MNEKKKSEDVTFKTIEDFVEGNSDFTDYHTVNIVSDPDMSTKIEDIEEVKCDVCEGNKFYTTMSKNYIECQDCNTFIRITAVP